MSSFRNNISSIERRTVTHTHMFALRRSRSSVLRRAVSTDLRASTARLCQRVCRCHACRERNVKAVYVSCDCMHVLIRARLNSVFFGLQASLASFTEPVHTSCRMSRDRSSKHTVSRKLNIPGVNSWSWIPLHSTWHLTKDLKEILPCSLFFTVFFPWAVLALTTLVWVLSTPGSRILAVPSMCASLTHRYEAYPLVWLLYVCVYVSVYVCMYTCIHTYMILLVCVYVCIYVYICVCMYVIYIYNII